MNTRVRRLVLVVLALYVALFVQLNLTQLARGEELNEHPLNTRSIEQNFTRPRGPITTADGIVIARTIEAETDLERLRVYPDGPRYAAVTGFLSLNYGAAAVEREWNDELAGVTAGQQIGSWSALFDEEPRVATVITSIDSRLQVAAEAAMAGRLGSVVALDPLTGEIFAFYSNPTFDPNELSSHDLPAVLDTRERLLADPTEPLRTGAYRQTFFPGSTFKVVTAAAALGSGLATTTEPVFPQATEYVPPLTNRPIRNFNNSECGGNLVEIMRVSCNTAFAELGVLLGPEILVATAEDVGFNRTPPLDLPDPEPSVFPEASVFDRNTPLLAQAAIGQFDVRATPLQIALIAAAVANGGVVPVPQVVEEVVNQDGVIHRHDPADWRRAFSANTAAQLTEMMRVVAESGTARQLLPDGVTGGGKTGTAQRGDGLTNAWIMGFAPLSAPRIAIAVVLAGSEASPDQTGGTDAAPVANAVLRAAVDAGIVPVG